jgi:hypothetical protein
MSISDDQTVHEQEVLTMRGADLSQAVTAARVCLAAAAVLSILSVCLDSWTTLTTDQKSLVRTYPWQTMITLSTSSSTRTESFGLFSAELSGAASFTFEPTFLKKDCSRSLVGTVNNTGGRPDNMCIVKCQSEQTFAILSVVFVIFANLLFTSNPTNVIGFSHNPMCLKLGMTASLLSFASMIICISLVGAGMNQKVTVTGDAGYYPPDLGICK